MTRETRSERVFLSGDGGLLDLGPVGQVELAEVDDEDEGLLVDKVLGDDELRGGEVADNVPRLAVEALALQDVVDVFEELLLSLLLCLLDPRARKTALVSVE